MADALKPDQELMPEAVRTRSESEEESIFAGAGYGAPRFDQTDLKAFSAYDLLSVEALVRYFHSAAEYPVRDTWLKAIRGSRDGGRISTNCASSKYCC